MHKTLGLDDLAGLASQVGLDPASYKTFQAGRIKPVPPMQETETSGAARPAVYSAVEQALQPNHELPLNAVDPPAQVTMPESPYALSEQPRLASSDITPHQMSAGRPPVATQAYVNHTADLRYSNEPLKKLVQFSRWDRWAALDVVLSSAGSGPANIAADLKPTRVPALSVAGVAGGVGTSSIAATLARISAKWGDEVIVFDLSSDSLLSLFFSGRCSPMPIASFVFSDDTNRGAIHTFRRNKADLAESPENWLKRGLDSLAVGSDQLVIDAGLNQSCQLNHAKISDSIQVTTLVPDTRCLAALKRSEDLRNGAGADSSHGTLLLLNQFDQTDPLHTEIRARLANRYPHRLIPIPIRRDRQVPAALAEGMTIVDYAPESSAAEDIRHLHQWLRSRQTANSSVELEKVEIL